MNEIWAVRAHEQQLLERLIDSTDITAAMLKYETLMASDAAITARDSKPLYAVSSGTAVISVQGILTKKPSFWAWLMGGGNATYTGIIAAIQAAEADSDVSDVRFIFDSPGGDISGMFDAAAATANMTKPSSSQGIDLVASAAYLLASQTGSITANNGAAEFGSIGIKTVRFKSASEIHITSTNAPEKDPDPTTADGVTSIRKRLDSMHSAMVDMIAAGRSRALGRIITADTVNQTFGRGGVLPADTALSIGMLDNIQLDLSQAGAGRSKNKTGNQTKTQTHIEGGKQAMNRDLLKQEHPLLFASVMQEGRDEGSTSGIAKERKRVSAHLKFGAVAGAMDFALKCVASGASFQDDDVQAEYLTARLQKQDTDARIKDNPAAVLTPTPSIETTTTDAEKQVAADKLLEDVMAVSSKPITAVDGQTNAHVSL